MTFKTLSRTALTIGEGEFTDEQKEAEWIGNVPASDAQITACEARLGVSLPEDYKALMTLTNGYAAPDYTEPSFLPIDEVDYLRTVEPFTIEAYDIEGNEEVSESLKRAVFVGGKDEDQHFFLIPPAKEGDDWGYWKFANWLPGEAPYDNLKAYFEEVIDILSGDEEE